MKRQAKDVTSPPKTAVSLVLRLVQMETQMGERKREVPIENDTSHTAKK